MQQQKKLTHGNLTNISVPLFPNCNIANTTTKHAPFAITRQLVHECRFVFSTWLPLSPFACLPLTQVQFASPLVKPILHLMSEWILFRLWISSLMKLHSSSVSMETRSPPWFWQVTLFQSQYLPYAENMYQEFWKVTFCHSTKWWKGKQKY